MKRRFLALGLAVCMLFGMLPISAMAEEETQPIHSAAFAEAVNVDGMAKETDWAWSGKLSGGTRFGTLWNKTHLYLAVQSSEAGDLSVTVNGVNADVSGAVSGTVTEVAIPLRDVNVSVNSYDLSVDAVIGFGTETWEGKLSFSPDVRNGIPELTKHVSPAAADSTENLGNTYSNGTYRQWNKYVEGGSYNSGGLAYGIGYADAVTETDKTRVVDFDFHAENMPIARLGAGNYSYAYCYGMSLTMIDGTVESTFSSTNLIAGYTVGIANTADGLAVCILTGEEETPAFNYKLLNKQVGDAFHVRLEYDTDDNLAVYVDDVLVETFANAYLRSKDYGAAFNGSMWLQMKTQGGVTLQSDGSMDTDYTVSNLRIGTKQTPDPLESLTFDTIKGSNTSAETVESNLVLPTRISNSMLTDAVITWTSSEPSVISAAGRVTPAAVEKTVTLTAAAASFKKEFVVTVPAAVPVHPAAFATAKVDGTVSETGWALSGKLSGGTPFGFVWDKENLYLAIGSGETAELAVSVNGTSVDVSGKKTGAATELAIPLQDIAVTVNSYEVRANATVTYGTESWSGKISFEPNTRVQVQGSQTQGVSDSGNGDNFGGTVENGIYHLWNKYREGAANTRYGSYFILDYQLTSLEAGKHKVVEFDFYAENLPVVTPGYLPYTAGYAGHGMNLVMINSEMQGYTVAIVNTENGLAFCVNGSEAKNGDDFRWVLLNKQVKTTFHMRLEYDTDGKLTVYADDVLVGVFEDTPLREKSWSTFLGAIWLYAFNGTASGSAYNGVPLLEDGSNDMDFTVSNLRIGTVETPNPLDSLTFDTIKGRNETADAIYSDLVLPAEFDTEMLSGVKLVWTSSDPSVISDTGAVTAPDTDTQVTVTAALVNDPTQTKSFTLTVEEASFVHPAAFATATVDGNANETSWVLSGKLSGGTPFGFLWDKENLYLAVGSATGDTLSVSVNNREAVTAGKMAVSATELAIPLSSIGVTVDRYFLSVPATIAYGDETWKGRITFDPNTRAALQGSRASGVGGDAVNFGSTVENGVYHLWNKYAEGAANANFGNAYILDYNLASMESDKTKVLEFDFVAKSLPVVTPAFIPQQAGYVGHGMNLSFVNSEKRGYVIGILNTADGLALCVNGNDSLNGAGYQSVLLNKKLGDTFHLRLEYGIDGDLTVYTDDTLTGVFEDTYLRAKSWGSHANAIWLNAFNGASSNKGYTGVQLTQDGTNDMDFTLSNLRIGTVETDPLDSLTFDAIRGGNETEDAIYTDLVLPGKISNDMLTDVKLSWTSSDPAVISNTGKVTAPVTDTQVTLTATLVSDPSTTKTFTLTVEAATTVHPAAFTEQLDADGALTEACWALSGKLSGGTPFGFAWDKKNVYLAINAVADDTLEVSINGFRVDVSAKQVGTATELVIPMSEIGVTVNSYALKVKASITCGTETWSGKLAFDPNARNMIPDLASIQGIAYGTQENLGYDFSDGTYRMWNTYNPSATNAASNKTGGYIYGYQIGTGFRGIGKTRVVEFDLRADKLPVITPNTTITVAHAGGYGLSVTLVNGGTDYAKSGFTAGFARTDEGLVFHAFDSSWVLHQTPLDKGLEETFHVRLEYSTNGDLAVYVDDEYVTTVISALLRPDDWGSGKTGSLWMTLYAGNTTSGVTLTEDGSNDMDFTVSNVRVGTKETGDLMADMSFEDIKGRNDSQNAVRKDLELVTELPHKMLSGVGISWTSSNESVISSTGKVTSPAVDTQVTLTAALNSDPSVTKEFVVTVKPFAVEAMLHEGAVNIDGQTGEDSWLLWDELADGSRIASIWNKGMVYFALDTQADTVTLTLNGHTLTVDVAALTCTGIEGAAVNGGDVLEIAIPHRAIGICLTDFNQTAAMGLTLTGDNGPVTLPAGAELIFTGKTKDTTYTTIMGALSRESLLGLADLMHVREDLDLPTMVETDYFEPFRLEWVTSDAGVITAEGAITRQETTYGYATLTLKFGEKELWTVDVTVDPRSAAEQPSAAKVEIGFAGDGILVDGSIAGEDWVMATRLMNGNQVTGEMGALWDEQNLYLAFQGGGELTLNVNGVTVTRENATMASAGEYREVGIPLDVIRAQGADYGDTVTVSVALGGGSWEGELVLTSTDWWMVGNRVDRMPVPDSMVSSDEYRGGGKPTKNQGAVEVENGWHIYDLYDPNGENPWNVRTYVIFMGQGYEGFDDREEGIKFEFDFEALSMPAYAPGHDSRSGGYSNYGITWSISDKAGADKYSNVIMGGIFNTEDGLYLVSKGSLREDVKLNKHIGDRFRVGLTWHANGTFDVYIDGELLVSYVNMDVPMHAIGNCSFVINCLRSADSAVKAEDSIDVYMTNLAFGKVYSEGGLNTLSFETFRGSNESQDAVTSDLVLPGKVSNGQLAGEMDLTWSSSNPAVIDPATGKVTCPAKGVALVTLTATDRNGLTRSFDLTVPGGENDNTGKLVVTGDVDPAVGVGKALESVLFTLDTGNNSVILDNGTAAAFTSVVLRDGDAFSRLNRESLTLWVSDDNITYTEIKDYKLLHRGENWYLYDFTATARYVKVHYTHFEGTDADFVGALSTMIGVGSGDFGSNGGTWMEIAVTLTNDSGKKWQDKAATLPGITGDSSTRVLLNGSYLYHYLDGSNIVVRIPDLAAGASLELTVLTGNSAALDISNKEAVYEVTYGTRETYDLTAGRAWITSLKKGAPLPNGQTVERDMVLRMDHSSIDVSYDGGVTWSKYSALSQEIRNVAFGYGGWADGGFIYDTVTGRLFYQMMVLKTQFNAGSMENNNSYMVIIYSDDAGKTWTYADTLEPDVIDGKPMNYAMSYNDGIMLSSYDGSGPNVDFVFTAGAQYDVGGIFCTRVAYSDDGGFTWQYSKNLLIAEGAADFEDGLSESSILENEDGVLVLYSRNQVKDAVTFAKCYSYDKGITWTSGADPVKDDADVVAEQSTVYSGPTEAVMQYWDFGSVGGSDKTPLLVWGGNNAEGGTSYMRSPLSIAVSYDGLENFRNIQNLYLETFLEAYSDKGKWRTTNPAAAQFGEDLVVVFDSNDIDGDGTNNAVQMIVSDFADWFYRTKGIYDSFEHGKVSAEGWNVVKGSALQTGAVHTDGNYAMKLSGETVVTRGIPYFQNGIISMDIYFAGDPFTLELQAAYTATENRAAPVGICVAADGTVTFTGSDAATGLTLQKGWNALTFRLQLTRGTGKLSIGEETVEIPVNTAAGDYICYLTFMSHGTVYVDDVLAESLLDAVVYTGEIEPVTEPEIAYNSVSLKGNIGVNYYMTLPEDVLAEEDAYMEFTVEGKTPVKIPVAEAIEETVDGKTCYVFTCQVAAKEMTDTITAQFVYSGGTVEAREFSVRAYADTILEDETGKYDSVKPLVEAMLRYGAYAQLHFGYRTDDLAVDELKDLSTVTAQTLAGFAGSGSGMEDALYRGNSLLLKSETSLRFFFQVAEGETLSATCDGKPLTATERGGMEYVAVENIAAKDLDTAYTLDVDGSQITASALTYAYNVLSAPDGTYTDDLENLVKALYLYNQAANTYFKN